MNYIEWITTIGLAINLLVKTDFNGDLTVRLEWKRPLPADLFSTGSVPSLCVSFYLKDDSDKLTEFHLIPWADLHQPYAGNKELEICPWKLFTVTEYAIIYENIRGSITDDPKNEYLDKLYARLKYLFDYERNREIISEAEGITTRGGLQLISQKEYRWYVEQQIAMPGSKSPLRFGVDTMPENKMVLRYLVPETGPVKTGWNIPERSFRDKCLDSSDQWILDKVKVNIGRLLQADSCNPQQVLYEAIEAAEAYLSGNNCNAGEVLSYYRNALKRIYGYREKVIAELPFDNMFGDYQPKLTPDELYDYMPSIYEEVKGLPPAESANLPDLLAGYKKYRRLAARNRGKWVEGNVMLGGNPREYEPSYEELMLCEVGNRISRVRENISDEDMHEAAKKMKLRPRQIKYRKFDIIHYDVMGSGRFFMCTQ